MSTIESSVVGLRDDTNEGLVLCTLYFIDAHPHIAKIRDTSQRRVQNVHPVVLLSFDSELCKRLEEHQGHLLTLISEQYHAKLYKDLILIS